jgi:hypothetical protein
MATSSWSRRFDVPIPLPAGGEFATLREAGEYIAGLSDAEQHKPHWRTATEMLLSAVERGGIVMLADIAMRRALAQGAPEPKPAPRKKQPKAYRIVK